MKGRRGTCSWCFIGVLLAAVGAHVVHHTNHMRIRSVILSPFLTLQVVWLDAVAARARYGRWVGGVLPEFVPFPKTGKARGGSKKAQQAQQAAGGGPGGVESEEEGGGCYVYLRRLRCVLCSALPCSVQLGCCSFSVERLHKYLIAV